MPRFGPALGEGAAGRGARLRPRSGGPGWPKFRDRDVAAGGRLPGKVPAGNHPGGRELVRATVRMAIRSSHSIGLAGFPGCLYDPFSARFSGDWGLPRGPSWGWVSRPDWQPSWAATVSHIGWSQPDSPNRTTGPIQSGKISTIRTLCEGVFPPVFPSGKSGLRQSTTGNRFPTPSTIPLSRGPAVVRVLGRASVPLQRSSASFGPLRPCRVQECRSCVLDFPV